MATMLCSQGRRCCRSCPTSCHVFHSSWVPCQRRSQQHREHLHAQAVDHSKVCSMVMLWCCLSCLERFVVSSTV